MATKLQDNTLARETYHVIGGRPLIVTLTPGGLRLHPKGTQQAHTISYERLYRQLEAEARRGGQSDISIPARKGRRS
jgi:hypothetical protein